MTKTKYNGVYTTLREEMEDGTYAFQESLSSESAPVRGFGCSGDTIRRAAGQLASERYMQSIYGKGVRVICQPRQRQSKSMLGSIESLRGVATRNRKNHATEVTCFVELTVGGTIRKRTTFPVEAQICCIQCVHCVEEEALITDHNYFLKDVVRGLTSEIAEHSIYEYVENGLDGSIVTTKRKMIVERANQIDKKYLDLEDYNCMAVMSNMTYSKGGVMSEFTQSRHRPDRLVFRDLAHRIEQVN